MRSRRSAVRVAGSALLTLGWCAACADDPAYPPGEQRQTGRALEKELGLTRTPTILLGLDAQASPSERVTQLGVAKVRIGEAELDNGSFDIVDGRDDEPALDFPEFSADDDDYPRAVVTVSNAGDADQLSPGTRNFMWGADFRLDKLSQGLGVDNGDNVVQRGLSSDPAYFKAEVDKDRAACTVYGTEGRLIIRASEQLTTGRWYRIRCERTADELAVYVTEFDPDGGSRQYASRIKGSVGDVTAVAPTTPLTIGGKVGRDGGLLASATDQFNGLVMNPLLDIEGGTG